MRAHADAKSTKVRGSRLFSLGRGASEDLPVLLSDLSQAIETFTRNEGADFHPDHAILLQTLKTTLKSDTVSAFFDEAVHEGWSIELAEIGTHDFHLDVPDLTITLNSHGLSSVSLLQSRYFQSCLCIALIRALRDIWQEDRQGGFEDRFGPEHILQLERVRNADCETVLVLAAWEIDQAGDAHIWRHLIASNEGDMAMVFSKSLDKAAADNQNAIYDAMNAAFKQWFASDERLNVCDHETLEYLDCFIAEEGQDAFGRTYLKAEHIEILSCLPNRIAYLQNRGTEILRNPLYCGMNDPINQSHFMHIMQDLKTTAVNGVSFRDADLAAKIFPELDKTSIHA